MGRPAQFLRRVKRLPLACSIGHSAYRPILDVPSHPPGPTPRSHPSHHQASQGIPSRPDLRLLVPHPPLCARAPPCLVFLPFPCFLLGPGGYPLRSRRSDHRIRHCPRTCHLLPPPIPNARPPRG